MLVFWISVTVFALGIVCLVVHDCWWFLRDWLVGVGVTATVLGMIFTFIFGLGALVVNIQDEIVYQKRMIEREAIVFRLENLDTEQNLNINGGVYDDVVTFNQELLEYKTWAHNAWIGCMWNDKVAEIDYIDFGGADYQNLPNK